MREDFELPNKRRQKLQVSWYRPQIMPKALPCVVYLHGNSSSRLEAAEGIVPLLGAGIMLVCFDFAGSGLSDGEYISLGYFEKDDVDVVVTHLRDSKKVSMIGLWGRSMGAVTALMHADRDPSLAGICLDSPFKDLKELAKELVKNRSKIPLPESLVESTLDSIRDTIIERAQFDIFELSPIKNNVGKSYIPAYFISAKDDELIPPSHAKDLSDAYVGLDKPYKLVEGTHNSTREPFVQDSIIFFFVNCFGVANNLTIENGAGKLFDTPGKPTTMQEPQVYSPPRGHSLNQGSANRVNQFMSEDEMLQIAINESLKSSQGAKPNLNGRG